MDRILIVDDEFLIRYTLEEGLKDRGYDAYSAATVEEGLEFVRKYHPGVLLLDNLLENSVGMDEIVNFKNADEELQVIMMTAYGSVSQAVEATKRGAYDYILKPFDVDELDARLRALLRRAAGRASPTIRLGDIELDPATRTVRQQGKPVEMSPREFSVLLVLLEARGRVLSRQQIEERLYSWDAAVESNAVEVHIHHLRRKLGSASIQTMRGVGYFMPQEKPA